MSAGYFITGTDTGVGKTRVSSALLLAFAAQGLRVVGMKPVAAGCVYQDGVLLSEDVAQLQAASNVKFPVAEVNPYAFEPPIAPHIAASRVGVRMEISVMVNCFKQLQQQADKVIVEGVGGFCVPLNDDENTADLALALNLPVIMVVGMRLGCINHALLTAEAIKHKGLRLVGWVANHAQPVMEESEQNIESLRQRLPAPLIGVLPYSLDAVHQNELKLFDLQQ